MSKHKIVAAIPPQVVEAEQNAPEPGVDLDALDLTVRSYTISTDAEYQQAGEMLRRIATAKNAWTEYWEPLVSAAKAVYDISRERRNNKNLRFDLLRQIYERKMSDYRNRRMIAATQEADRLQDQLSQARKRLEQQAKSLLVQGKMAESRAVKEQARLTESMTIAPEPLPTIEGVSHVPEYEVEITDLAAFLEDVVVHKKLPLRGVVQGKEVDLLSVRDSLLKEYRKSMGTAFAVAGVKVTEKLGYRVKDL